MIRTILIPADKNIVLVVPDSYVGKRIEVLIFDTDEVRNSGEATTPLKPSQLRGFLTNETAEALQQHIEQSRKEWDTL